MKVSWNMSAELKSGISRRRGWPSRLPTRIAVVAVFEAGRRPTVHEREQFGVEERPRPVRQYNSDPGRVAGAAIADSG
jgi:hypothetical protein